MDAKKAAILVGCALVAFYVVTDPTQATAAVTTLLTWLKDGVEAIIRLPGQMFG